MNNNNENLRNRGTANTDRGTRNRADRPNINPANNLRRNRLVYDLAPGALFYPSCGRDSADPIRLFVDAVTEFHFVDHAILTPLAIMERNNQTILRDSGYVINRTVYSEPKGEQLERNYSFWLHPANEEKCFHESWEYTTREKQHLVEVFRHHADNLEAFEQIDKISVFFYRGDSLGEGGSGQMWMGPELFPRVVEKLTQRAIIVTDGFNYAETDLINAVPWQPMLKNYPQDRNRDFHYQDRQFLYLGSLTGHPRISGIWLVI